MANKRYNEDGDGEGLSSQVKGKKDASGAAFSGQAAKGGDDAKADLNKTGVALPSDSEKHLPKAGGKTV